MSRLGSIPLWILLLASVLRVPANAANEPPWLEIRSAHFTIITDAGDKKGREIALRFEQMRAVFSNLLGKDRLNQSIPLTILALRNDKLFYQVAPLHQGQPIEAPGFLLPGQDQVFIVLNASADEPWRAVAHDFALMLLNYNYPAAQGWFDEGLAEYFGSIRLDNREVQIGGDPELSPSVAEDLLGNQRETHPAKSLTELLGAQTWLSLPDLFTMKHDPSTRNEGTHHTLYYAESWIVMHYLLHEKKLPETGTYFGLLLNQNLPVEEAIQQAYGISSAQLEQAVKDYFHSQAGLSNAVDGARTPDTARPAAAQTDRFPTPVAPNDSAITSKPISDGEVRAIYAGIQVRIPERRELGLKTLDELATTPTTADQKAEAKHETKRMGEDPEQLPSNAIGNPVAHRILAWDHIQHGQFDEAFAELKAAADLNPNDMWIRYYVSVAKYRYAQARHSDIPGLSNMMLDLKSVLEWYPEMADAYDLLAVARNTGGGPSAALQAERAAIILSPRDERYRYHLAEIYVASKNWEAANALLAHLKVSSDPQVAAQANELLSQAGAQRKYGIPVDAKGTALPKYAPQKSPFDVLEEDAAKRADTENPRPVAHPSDNRAVKFAKGRLVRVDCSKAPAALLTVSSESGVLKLRTTDYKSILLIGADDFSCDWREREVTVNYKPGPGAEGDIVSLEVR